MTQKCSNKKIRNLVKAKMIVKNKKAKKKDNQL